MWMSLYQLTISRGETDVIWQAHVLLGVLNVVLTGPAQFAGSEFSVLFDYYLLLFFCFSIIFLTDLWSKTID